MPRDGTKIRPCTKDEAQSLLPLAQAGDEEAAARMIAGVSAFILRTAKKYAGRIPEADFDDLEQAGLIAASQSIAGYDPSRGTAAWTSYAMTAAARGIAREAFRSKQLTSRFPTGDSGTEVDPDHVPIDPEKPEPVDESDRESIRGIVAAMDPLDRTLIQYIYGFSGTVLDKYELCRRLGISLRVLAVTTARAYARLKIALEEAGIGKALGEE